MEDKLRLFKTIAISAVFIFIAFASSEKKKPKWEANDTSLFCDKEFKGSYTNTQLGITEYAITVFNKDGTFNFKLGWRADKSVQDVARSTIGRASEEVSSNGTWEIIKPTEALKGDYSLEKFNPTYIKYQSKNGYLGYAKIYCYRYKYDTRIKIDLLTSNGNEEQSDGEAIGIESGVTDNVDIEAVAEL